MIEDVKLILSKPVNEVIATSLTITLLRTYSKLYLGGGQPRCCARSQREYYRKLQNNGLELAEMYEKAMERTFKLNYKGLLHVTLPKKGLYAINTELISDEMALDFLEKGVFTEKDFTVLPKNYNKFEETEVIKEKVIESSDFKEPQNKSKRGRKKK